jgi:hypothetical protein
MTILVLGLGLALTPGTMAAKDKDQFAEMEKMSEEDMQALGLSDAQREQIRSINQNRREQMEAIKNDSALKRKEKKQQIRQINRSSNEAIHGELSPQQQERYRNRIRERHENRVNRKEDVSGGRTEVRERREGSGDSGGAGGGGKGSGGKKR